MRQDFRCRGPGFRVQGEEGSEQLGAGEGEEGEFGADDGAGCVWVAGEAEGAGVGEAFEAGPGLLGGDAAELEDLWGLV